MPSGRLRKPASMKKGKSETKEHLDKRAKIEEELAGNSDLLYDIPEQLSDLGKKYYLFIVSELMESGVLGNLDIPILTQTADMLAIVEELTTTLNHDGLMIKYYDKDGNVLFKPHPAVKMKLDFMKQLSAYYTQLGMTPSSRASLAEIKLQNEQEQQDPLLKALSETIDSDKYDDE